MAVDADTSETRRHPGMAERANFAALAAEVDRGGVFKGADDEKGWEYD